MNIIWQAIAAWGSPDPLAAHLDSTAAVLDIGVLVFREGLECILVLAAVTAGMVGARAVGRRPIAVDAGAAFICTLITWRAAIGVIDDLTAKVSALALQAATGLAAILVLVVVMNWFFHKVYWAGWISMHTRKKQALMREERPGSGEGRLWFGLALLGFTSFYREGFEVVLFLQSYRIRLGGRPVFFGVLIGMMLSGIIAILTFVVQRRLPFRRMLVLTGVMLGGVLLVMVGEQAQEMQLAHWLPKTDLPSLARMVPPWMGLWFSVFPTVETITAQCIAAGLVLGSYFAARSEGPRRAG